MSGIIENVAELKNLYLKTDLTDATAVQTAIKEIDNNVYVTGKEQYVAALSAATASNIAKARKYNNAPSYMRYLGWGVLAIFFMLAMIFDDSGLFEDSTVTWPYIGCWVGIGIQIYIAILKSAWKKLTLSGAVIHPVLISTVKAAPTVNSKNIIHKTASKSQQPTDAVEDVFCGECGRKNKASAQYCENCGAKL